MERSEILAIIGIIAVVAIGLYANYAPYSGKISHSMPVMVNAGDPNSRISESENILETGSAGFMPPWFTGEKDLMMTQPPLNLILAALVAGSSGLKVYDTLFFNAVIASIGAALGFFVLFSRVFKNRMLGLIAAALIVFPLEEAFRYMLKIGMYANFSIVIFYPLALIFTYEFVQKQSWQSLFLLVLSLTLQFLLHSASAVMLGAAICLYILLFERKKISWKKAVIASAMFIVLVLPYLPIIYVNFYSAGSGTSFFSGQELVPPEYEPKIFLGNVLHPIFWMLAILAVVITFNKKEYRLLNFLFLFYITVIFILAKFGIGQYYISIRTRYIFYIFAYPLVAIGLYTIASAVQRFLPVRKAVFMAAVVVLILAGQAYSASKIQQQNGYLYTEDVYNGLLWLRAHSPKDAQVLCFGCNQLEGTTSHRVTEQVIYWEQKGLGPLLQVANNNSTKLFMQYSGYADERLVRTGFISFKKRGSAGDHVRDLCEFDYFFIRAAQAPINDLFNRIAVSIAAKNASIVYQSPQAVILKNNNKGGECI